MTQLATRPPVESPVIHAINDWLAAHTGRTHITYALAYRRILPYLREAPLTPARAAEIRDALLRTYKPASVQVTFRAMSSLWNQFRERGLVRDNPWQAAARQIPVPNRRARRLLTHDELVRIVAACRTLEERTLVRFLLYSGLRLAEATTVTWADLRQGDDKRWRLTVFGKGHKTRTVVLPGSVVGALRLMAVHHGRPVQGDVTILPWAPRTVQAKIARIGRRAGIDRPISPHWFRHAYATQALNHGAPLHVVQASLGHAQITTTGIYADAAPDQSAGDWIPDEF